jgi:hypothetical protein
MKLSTLINKKKVSALKNGFNKIFKTKEITLSLLATLVLTSPLHSFDNVEVPLTTHNANIIEQLTDVIGIGSSQHIVEQLSLLSEDNKIVVIVLDNDDEQYNLIDKYNTPRQLSKFSHMEMVDKVLTTDLSYFGDRDIAVINANVFDQNHNHVLDIAFDNIEEALEQYPEKEFIINLSLGGGKNLIGNVPYHDYIINLVKKYPNLKVVKSAGNATPQTSQLHFTLFKMIKPDMYHEFIEKGFLDMKEKPSIEELKPFFADDIMPKVFLYNFDMYKELYQIEKNNFEEIFIFQEKLGEQYNSPDISLEEKQRLADNIIISKGYSFSDFVENFNMLESMQNNPDAIELYNLLKNKNFIESKTFNTYKYKLFYNSETSSEYLELEKKLESFINKYQDSHKEFFYITSINSVATPVEGINVRYGITDLVRTKTVQGEELKLLCTGTSTASPSITKQLIEETQNAIFLKEHSEKVSKVKKVRTKSSKLSSF